MTSLKFTTSNSDMKVIILNHQDRVSLRIQYQIKALEKAGYTTALISWDRHPKQAAKTGKSSIFSLPLVYWYFFQQLKKEKPNIIHCTHIMLLPFALFYGKIKGTKVVYDDYDYFTLMFSEKLPTPLKWVGKLIHWIENMLVKFVDQVFVIDLEKNTLRNRYRRFNNQVMVLNNAPELIPCNEILEVPNEVCDQYKDHKLLVYVGGIKEDKCVSEIVKAFNQVSQEMDSCKALFIGEFRDHSKRYVYDYIDQYNLTNIDFLPWQPYEKMLQYVRLASVGFALYKPHPRYLLARGNARKIFTYMLCSVPIIASDFPGLRKIISVEECGIVVDPTNVREIAEGILRVLRDPVMAKQMGERGRKAVEQKYNWEIEQSKFLQAYKRLITQQ